MSQSGKNLNLTGDCYHVRPPSALTTTLLIVLVAIARPPHAIGASEPGTLRLGSVDFPSSGAAAAQPHFRRGVAALHSFWYEEALAAFDAALRIDPDYAMAWWGVAMAYHRPYVPGSDHDTGRRALARIRGSANITARERAYIEALRVFYAEGTIAARTVAYAAAMEKVHRDHPDDLEAAAFHALALLGHWCPYTDDHAREEKAGAIALDVFRRNPLHPGAAHYIIHSFDDPDLAGRALEAAQHYATIAPDASHALHMPSHIFLQLGRWRETAASNEAGWAASETWVRRRQLSPTLRDYHNYHWLIYANLQQGRHAQAADRVHQFVAMRRDIAPTSRQYFNRAMASFVIETESWDRADELLALDAVESTGAADGRTSPRALELCGGAPAAAPANPAVRRSAVASFIRAYAAAARGAADAEQRWQEMSTVATDNSSGPEFWRICVLEAAAVRHVRAKAFDLAIPAMREATALEEALGKTPGPPPSFKPPHELFGEVLLQAGRPDDAVRQFASALDRHPGRPLALLGRARAEASAGHVAAAAATYAQLLEIWRNAEVDLPARREALEFVARESQRRPQ